MKRFVKTYGDEELSRLNDPEDVLNQHDTISLSEMEWFEPDEMTIAGVDEHTAVDTFLKMQGDRTFVTEI